MPRSSLSQSRVLTRDYEDCIVSNGFSSNFSTNSYNPTYNSGEKLSCFGWVKISQNANYIFSQFAYMANQRSWLLYTDNTGKLRVLLSNNGTAIMKSYIGTNAIADGAWHFIAMTWNTAVGLKLYVDGKEETVTKITDNPNLNLHQSISKIAIGHGYSSLGTPVGATPGSYKMFATVPDELTAQQIADIYYRGEIDFTTSGYWKIDEASGATLIDSSGNGRDISAFNGTWSLQGPYKKRAVSVKRYPVKDIFQKSIGSLSVSTSAAITPDHVNLQNIFDTGGAVSFWFNERTMGGSNIGSFISKTNPTSTGGWQIRHYGSLNIRFWKAFSGTYAAFRLSGSVLGNWNWLFVWYDASNVANIPVCYYAVGFNSPSAVTVTVATAPVGTAQGDTGMDVMFCDTPWAASNFDGNITGIKLFRGTAPTLEQIKDLYYNDITPSTLSLIDTWRKGTVDFESDTGLHNAVLSAPATLTDYVPVKTRTPIT